MFVTLYRIDQDAGGDIDLAEHCQWSRLEPQIHTDPSAYLLRISCFMYSIVAILIQVG